MTKTKDFAMKYEDEDFHKMKTKNICECGHEKKYHRSAIKILDFTHQTNCMKCPCKKFVPQSPLTNPMPRKSDVVSRIDGDTQSQESSKASSNVKRSAGEPDALRGISLSDKMRVFKEGEEIWTDGTNEVFLVEDVKEAIQEILERIGSSKRITTERAKEIIKSEMGRRLA